MFESTCLSRQITHSELSPLARIESCLASGAEGNGWSNVTFGCEKKVIKWKFKTIEQDVMVKILQMTQLFDIPAGADNACN